MGQNKKIRIISYVTISALLSSLVVPFTGNLPMAQAATKASSPVELQSFDTEYANVYRNPDGTLFSKVYFAPVNYKDKLGNFQHIDTDIQPNSDATFGVTKNVFETQFGSAGNSSSLDTVTYQGKKVSFSLVPTSISGKMDSHTFTNPGHVKPTTNHNEIHYDGVYPSVSLQERVTSSGVKEAFVLKKYQSGLHSFAFVVNTDGVAPKIASDGSVHFVDQNGKTVFLIPHGIMQDSNIDPQSGDPQTSNAVTYGLQQITGKTILTVSVDENWLADPSRKYPVYVDPTIQASQISDAYVSSAYPTTNYSGSSLWNANQGYYDLHVGYYDSTTGTNWAYFKLPSASSLPLLGLTVSSATFHAYCDWSYYASTAEPTSLFANTSSNWSTSTVTWNTTPSYNGTSLSSASTYRGQWASFDVHTLVQDWSNEIAGTSHTYDPTEGFFLSEAGAGQDHWHKFAASENSSSSGVQPYITINYNAPTAPYGGLYEHPDGSASGFVNLWWNAVPGAASYNVKIWDGHQYELFNTPAQTDSNGNQLPNQHWTSKGKGIWLTQAEISAGDWQLHHDAKGTELAANPSQVYQNAYVANGSTGTNYGTDQNYWFRIEPLTTDGQVGPGSDAFTPTMQAYTRDEGDAATMVPLFVGEANGATGDFVLGDTDLTTKGLGPQVAVSRTYNSDMSATFGPLGNGWSFNYGTHIEISNNNTYLVEPDGQRSLWWQQAGTSNYVAPPGESTWSLKSGTISTGASGYTLTLDDQSIEEFAPEALDTSKYHLVDIQDNNKNKLSFTYNNSDQLTSVTDQSGRVTNFTYNTDGTINTITDFNNDKWTYGYTSGNLTSVTDPDGNVIQYGYSTATGYLNSVTTPAGNTYTIAYDATTNKVSGETNPLSKSESVTYGTNLATFTDPTGIETQWQYDIDHLITQETFDPTSVDPSGLNRVWTYTDPTNNQNYNEFFEPPFVIDPTGAKTIYAYDNWGQLTQVTDGNSHTTKVTYNGSSTLGSINTDVSKVAMPAGGSYNFEYDSNHNQMINKVPQGSKLNTSRNTNGTPSADVSVPADNILTNNSFESWSGSIPDSWNEAMASHTDVKDPGYFGANAWGVTGASGAVELFQSSVFQPISASDTNGVSFSAYAKATSTNAATSTYVRIDYYDSNKNWIPTTTNGPNLQVAGQWERLTVTADPKQYPANAVYCRPILITAPSGSDKVDVDALTFTHAVGTVPDYNAFVNGSFYNQLNGWNNVNGSLSSSTSPTMLGDQYSANLSVPAGSPAAGLYATDSNQYIPYVAGQTYWLGGFIKGSGAGSTYVILKFVDSNKNWLGQTPAASQSGNFDWTHISTVLDSSVTVPSGTTYVEPEVISNAPASGTGQVWIDDLYLSTQPQATNYGYSTNYNDLTSVTGPLGNKTTYTYDSKDDLQSITDPNGNVLNMLFDPMHLLQNQSSTPDNLKVSYTYDGDGNVKKVTETDTTGSTQYASSSNTYTKLDEVYQSTDPLGLVTTNMYDDNGRLKQVTLPDGNSVLTGYDNAGEPKSVSIQIGTGTPTVVNQYGYDGDGRVTSLQWGGLTTSFTRDKVGNIQSQTDSTGSQSFLYNNDNALTQSKITLGTTTQTTNLQVNGQDQVVSSSTALSGGAASSTTFGYNAAQQIASIQHGNGVSSSFQYDGAHRVQTVMIGGANGAIYTDSFGYDNNGNIVSWNAATYGYDAMNRLTSESHGNQTVSYNYDPLGNMIQKTVTANGTPTTTKFSYDSQHQELTAVNGQAYTYDANGNLLSNGTYSFKWNELGQLTEVDNSSGTPIALYTYDAEGRRASEQAGGGTTRFVYIGTSNLVAYETDGSGNLLRSYAYSPSGSPLTMTTWSAGTGTTYYYETNGHGDVVALTDANKTVVASYTYDAWGNILTSSGSMANVNPYLYAGYRFDRAIWMYYLNARYYDQNTMRFISPDPLGGLSPYVYADDNPINEVDPDGTWALDAMWLVLDVASFAASPSWGGAAWIAGDLASFADPTGAASTAIHAAKMARSADRLAEGYRAASKYYEATKGTGKADQAIVNSKGDPYPNVQVEGYGKVPLPDGPYTPNNSKLLRPQFTASFKNQFKEWWTSQGRPWPEGNVNIHHIKPLSKGGDNSFENLVPLIQPDEHQPFTNWWRNFP